jgi:replicative DNA helicase Mcm
MNTTDLTNYVNGWLTPERLKDIERTGKIEIDFDPTSEADIAENSKNSEDVIKDAIAKILPNINIDVNFLGFDSQQRKLDDINQSDVGKLIKIRGYINADSEVKPYYNEIKYICRDCGDITMEIQEDPFKITAPLKCENITHGKHKCGCLKFTIDYDNSKYIDRRKLKIQEAPEDVSGQIPRWKDVIIFKKTLLHKVRCGDYVNIVGLVKVKSEAQSRICTYYIEANNIVVQRKDLSISELTELDKEKINELIKQPNIYEKLIYNIAPSLYGMELEKEAALLSLIGGVKDEGKEINQRDCIHVLYAGDPAVGKSQLLWAVHNLAPLGIYCSAKGVSSAGLTAAVLKDEETKGDYVIAAGVMVLADNGIAAIDEIDKMKPEDRDAMNSAMEQQVVPVNKANIHTTLKSRTTVLAAANPIMGRYDPNKTVGDNIKNLPTVLLTRFDLIFIIQDIPNEERDRKLINHILADNTNAIERDLLKKYIISAKSFKPIMMPEAKAILSDFYVESRKIQLPDDPVPISARYFEALIRLAQAHAKALFKCKVDIDDAKAATRILGASLKQTCKFQTAGANINLIQNPVTTKQGKEGVLLDIIDKEGTLTEDQWRDMAKLSGISDDDFKKTVMQLLNKGQLIRVTFAPPTYRLASRGGQ